jgi:hypothetical protein
MEKDITLFRLPPDLTSTDRERFGRACYVTQEMLTQGGLGAVDRSQILQDYASQRGMMDDIPEEQRPPYFPFMWLQQYPFRALQFTPDNDKLRLVYAVSTLIPLNYPHAEQYGLFDFMLSLLARQIYDDEKRRLGEGQTLYYDYLIEGIKLTLFLKV